jgi:hypothetical protein
MVMNPMLRDNVLVGIVRCTPTATPHGDDIWNCALTHYELTVMGASSKLPASTCVAKYFVTNIKFSLTSSLFNCGECILSIRKNTSKSKVDKVGID